jgi:hypothetical protein
MTDAGSFLRALRTDSVNRGSSISFSLSHTRVHSSFALVWSWSPPVPARFNDICCPRRGHHARFCHSDAIPRTDSGAYKLLLLSQ